MGAMKAHLMEMQHLLQQGKYLELLQDCKTWENPAEQLWAIVSFQVFHEYPETGWINSNKVLPCPRHEGNFDCTPFCDICEGKQDYEYTPTRKCLNCVTQVDHDIWFEELGYCVDCSHKYWNGELN